MAVEMQEFHSNQTMLEICTINTSTTKVFLMMEPQTIIANHKILQWLKLVVHQRQMEPPKQINNKLKKYCIAWFQIASPSVQSSFQSADSSRSKQRIIFTESQTYELMRKLLSERSQNKTHKIPSSSKFSRTHQIQRKLISVSLWHTLIEVTKRIECRNWRTI